LATGKVIEADGAVVVIHPASANGRRGRPESATDDTDSQHRRYRQDQAGRASASASARSRICFRAAQRLGRLGGHAALDGQPV
jgi:hypothetical protein